jgi:hypothetical protein
MLSALMRAMDHVWVFFSLFAGLFLLGAVSEIHNVSRSPAVGRYLALAILSAVLAIVFHFVPLLHR